MLNWLWYNNLKLLFFVLFFISIFIFSLQNDNFDEPIAIIGGGFAGISAFNTLKKHGYKNVKIFEGSNRIGGRVYPFKYKDGYLQLGAQFINGKKNPIYKIAKKLNIINGVENDDGFIYMGDYKLGKCKLSNNIIETFSKFSHTLERYYEKLSSNNSMNKKTVGDMFSNDYKLFLLKETKISDKIEKKKYYDALAKLYKSYFETEWSSPIEKLSLVNLDLWDDKEDELKSYTLNNVGFKAILDYLSENITDNDISYNSRIINIDYSNYKKILLTLSNGKIITNFSKIIVTIPLGHLKKNAYSLFTPTLNKKRMRAINSLGFGNMQKIFFQYDKPFWNENTKWIHTLSIDGCTNTNIFSKIFQSFQPLEWMNNNILVGWISGKGPNLIKNIPDDILIEIVTNHFQDAFNNYSIPKPTKILQKSWVSDELYLGSYTYHTPESTLLNEDPIKTISRPIYKNNIPIIMFAGEGTHPSIYQTVIGAYLSGQREANRIFKYSHV
ncbi:Amine oxidase domain-containing protein [Strongyloides ratti]|uniref:Amine oxidase domain-containing protein n=1 Tax=Strongyloides ratti TaxID=34506 RepID=A0A090KVM3_STRRB|nr:Amine oxidase domain-containing protein [Strongyloides ratti]CEF59920.1 Amine oxidase domain-containing protein [Strongyloides ratti]